MGKTRVMDGIGAGHKHSEADVSVKILRRMAESRRRNRPRKPVLAKWRGSPILTLAQQRET